MIDAEPARVHVVCGGGVTTGHDMDYVRLRILQLLQEPRWTRATVANDLTDLSRWLVGCKLLITYVVGMQAEGEQHTALESWVEGGGHWLALHGTSTGTAIHEPGPPQVDRTPYHRLLGSAFLSHPPIRKFRVSVTAPEHALTQGVPSSFVVADELYLVEPLGPESAELLLTTEFDGDPCPPGWPLPAPRIDTSTLADGKTRALGHIKQVGRGSVIYLALGHCHSPATKRPPFVHESVNPSGEAPSTFRGAWESPHFLRLLRNAIAWGLS